MLKKIFTLLACTLFLQVLPAYAASFISPVVSVLDGDTIEVLHDGRAERIRMLVFREFSGNIGNVVSLAATLPLCGSPSSPWGRSLRSRGLAMYCIS